MNGKAIAGAILGLGFLGLLVFAVLPAAITWPSTGPGVTGVGLAMWQDRTFEVIIQSLILLGGVVAILLLLGSRRSREVSP
jgi:ABC-type Fe3+ transport system permease subunit